MDIISSQHFNFNAFSSGYGLKNKDVPSVSQYILVLIVFLYSNFKFVCAGIVAVTVFG